MLMFNADELFERLGLTVNCEDCKRHNKDYINKCDNSTWMEVCDILDYMTPIDAEPVVRCKDCRWWDNSEDSPYGYCMAMKHGYMSKNWEIGIYRRYKGDFYCADAERKDDD